MYSYNVKWADHLSYNDVRSGMDLGYVDDNSAMFPSLDGEGVVAHEPLMAFEASPVAANDDREAAEERKSSSVDAFPQHVTRQQSNNRTASNRTATAKTLISEVSIELCYRKQIDSCTYTILSSLVGIRCLQSEF